MTAGYIGSYLERHCGYHLVGSDPKYVCTYLNNHTGIRIFLFPNGKISVKKPSAGKAPITEALPTADIRDIRFRGRHLIIRNVSPILI